MNVSIEKKLQFSVSKSDEFVLAEPVNHGVQLQEGEMMLDAMSGFLIFVNRAGKIIYVHHQVAEVLGIQQVCTFVTLPRLTVTVVSLVGTQDDSRPRCEVLTCFSVPPEITEVNSCHHRLKCWVVLLKNSSTKKTAWNSTSSCSSIPARHPLE